MRRLVVTRWLVAVITATLLFQAGAVAPAFVTATGQIGSTIDSDPAAPERLNSVPLARRQPVAPVIVEGTSGGVTPPLGVTVRAAPIAYQPPEKPDEVEALRSEFGRVVAQPDGSFTAEYFMGRVNFLDADGEFQPIDLNLIPDADTRYGLRTTANSFDLRISARGDSAELAELSLGDRVIRLRHASQPFGDPARSPDGVTYPSAADRGQVSLLPTPEGLEFTVTLADKTQGGTYQFILDTGGLKAEPGPEGRGVLLRDATGAVVASVSPPTIFDATERPAPRNAITTLVSGPASVPAPDAPATALPSPSPSSPDEATTPSESQTAPPELPQPPVIAELQSPLPSADPETSPTPTSSPPTPGLDLDLAPTEVLLTYTIDPTWLAQPEVAFPVVLDPTICVQKGQTVAADGCDSLASSTGYLDHFILGGLPNYYPYNWTYVRVGKDAQGDGYGNMRALFYFPDVALPDGGQLTNATLRLRENANFGSNQQIYFSLITKGWHAQTTWNSQPTYGATTSPISVLNSGSLPDFLNADVTDLARTWYTRNANDWQANLGLMARLVTETQSEVNFRNKAFNTVDYRPRLAITYVVPKVSIDFDTATLGADFVPTTMPAGLTLGLPVKVTNDNSGFAFNHSGSDRFALGYRWFDAAGKPVVQSGFQNWGVSALPATINNNATSAVINVPVSAPPQVGQYALRFDLVHVVGAANVWGSDFASPSLYYSGARASAETSNTRVVGSSVVERADFTVAVVGGGGTAVGEMESVGLADGSTLGVNLWSRNLHFDGHSISELREVVGSWDRGTFRSRADSIRYHHPKHAPGQSVLEYTREARSFFTANRSQFRPVTPTKPGWKPALRLKTATKTGWFTPHGRILTYWRKEATGAF